MMAVTACPSTERLKALSIGAVSELESDELTAHLDDCSTCRNQIETIEDGEDSLIASLRGVDEHAGFEREADCRLAVAKALGALAAASPSGELDLPETIGEYEVVRPLGRGGMGRVFLARHTKLGREVALKVLASTRLGNTRYRERFEAEMRAVGRLSHPNIVTAHDAREVDGTAVLITEFIDGLDLGQLLGRVGPLSIANACEITRQVALALEYTNGRGFVHRDVKPSNIMLSREGEVKLLDLGLARLQYGDETSPELTGTGQAMGTADFIAPEQVTDSRSVDVRADVYGLGCTLMKLLTGHAPFEDAEHATAFAKMTAHVNTAPPQLGQLRSDAPAALAALLDSMLAKSPDKRPQAPLQVATELGKWSGQADLQALSSDAEAASMKPPKTAAPRPSGAVQQPWRNRRVPVMALIATGIVSLFVGICLGILIKITFPDGTTVEISNPKDGSPPPTRNEANRPGVPQANDAPAGYDAKNARTTVRAYIAPWLAVVASPTLDREDYEAAKQVLLRTEGNPSLVPTDGHGAWIKTRVPAESQMAHNGTLYALTSARGGIGGQDVIGHMSAVTQSVLDGKARMTLHFDDELAARANKLSELYANHQLALIVNNEIVAAPMLRWPIEEPWEIEVELNADEQRQLMEFLRDGARATPMRLQDDLTSTPSVKHLEIRDQLVGKWSVASSSQLEADGVFLLFEEDDRFAIVRKERPGWEVFRRGAFHIGRRVQAEEPAGTAPVAQPAYEIDFVDLSDEKMEGLVTFVTPTQVKIVIDESKTARPTAFQKRQGWELLNLERTEATVPVIPVSPSMLSPKAPPTPSEATLANLHQFGLAFHNYHDAYRVFPSSANSPPSRSPRAAENPRVSWRVAILPFVGEQQLYEQYRFDEPWDGPHNRTLLDRMPRLYRSPYAPDDQPAGHANYLGFSGDHSALGATKGNRIADMQDGASNVLLLFDSAKSVPWTKPEDIPFDPETDIDDSWFHKDQPMHHVRVDGSPHIMHSIEDGLLKRLIMHQDGKPLDPVDQAPARRTGADDAASSVSDKEG